MGCPWLDVERQRTCRKHSSHTCIVRRRCYIYRYCARLRQGNSKEIAGEAFKGIPRDELQILTKLGMRWDLAKGDFAFKSKNNEGKDIDTYKYAARESIIKECKDSLRRLGTYYIDLYQIYWPGVTTPIQETMETIAELIKQGKCAKLVYATTM